jgi:hypothetical protein
MSFIPKISITKVLVLLLLTLVFSSRFYAQDSLQIIKKRKAIVISATALTAVSTIYGLNELWYKNYPKSKFQFFNDNNEWMAMDKIGHSLSCYQTGKIMHRVFKEAGFSENTSLWFAGTLGFQYLFLIEMLDGYSAQWGFSKGDLLANTLGTLLFVGQEKLFNKQTATLKVSFLPSPYAPYRPDLLGKGFIQEFFKDYNGQTYWLSLNLKDITNIKSLPEWLSLAIGYGADGMLGAVSNPLSDKNLKPLPTFNRQQQYYLSFDIQLSRIKTKSKWANALLYSFDIVKIPLPGIMLQNKQISFQPLAY